MVLKEISAGCIVLSKESVLIVKNKSISYSFPKGHIKGEESVFNCAKRELFEETGLSVEDLEFAKDLGSIQREDGYKNTSKKIHYFLFYTPNDKQLNCQDKNNEAFWIKKDKAKEFLSYKEERDLLKRIFSSSFSSP